MFPLMNFSMLFVFMVFPSLDSYHTYIINIIHVVIVAMLHNKI